MLNKLQALFILDGLKDKGLLEKLTLKEISRDIEEYLDEEEIGKSSGHLTIL